MKIKTYRMFNVLSPQTDYWDFRDLDEALKQALINVNLCPISIICSILEDEQVIANEDIFDLKIEDKAGIKRLEKAIKIHETMVSKHTIQNCYGCLYVTLHGDTETPYRFKIHSEMSRFARPEAAYSWEFLEVFDGVPSILAISSSISFLIAGLFFLLL